MFSVYFLFFSRCSDLFTANFLLKNNTTIQTLSSFQKTQVVLPILIFFFFFGKLSATSKRVIFICV